MVDTNSTPLSGGTTSADGVDVQGRAARAAAAYQKNPATATGSTPAGAVILDAHDDIASASAKAMAANSDGDADVLARVGATWGGIRARLDAVAGDTGLSPEGKRDLCGEAFADAAGLVHELRADAVTAEGNADALEQRVEDDLLKFDDVEGEEKRALFDALMKMPGESLGAIFVGLCEKPIGEWRRHEAMRVISILRLHDAGALPSMPNYHLQAGWQALLAQSPYRENVAAARSRADVLNRMAGSVAASALKAAARTGNTDELRGHLGLDELMPGRVGQADVTRARVLDIPASPADEARWGKQGRR